MLRIVHLHGDALFVEPNNTYTENIISSARAKKSILYFSDPSSFMSATCMPTRMVPPQSPSLYGMFQRICDGGGAVEG